jgi:hypothetical protein
MGGDTGAAGNVPDLDFAVERTRYQVLARVIPIQGGDPGGTAGGRWNQVAYVFAVLDIVDGDNPSVASRGEALATRREDDSADRLGQA